NGRKPAQRLPVLGRRLDEKVDDPILVLVAAAAQFRLAQLEDRLGPFIAVGALAENDDRFFVDEEGLGLEFAAGDLVPEIGAAHHQQQAETWQGADSKAPEAGVPLLGRRKVICYGKHRMPPSPEPRKTLSCPSSASRGRASRAPSSQAEPGNQE